MQRLIGGIALGGLGLFMLSGYFNADVARSSPASLAALLLVAGLPLVGSVLLIRSHFRDKHRLQSRKDLLRQQTVESEILKLAMARGGKLTAVEVATEFAIAPEGAVEALDRLALRGQATYEVTDAGVIVYSFYDIMHLGGKESARDVLDA